MSENEFKPQIPLGDAPRERRYVERAGWKQALVISALSLGFWIVGIWLLARSC
jgi:hypothetical protein